MIPFGPQGCRHWWVEPASWPRCGRWWSSGPSSRQSCPQTCPRQRQQRTSPSETQQRCSFNKMNELKCHRFTLHINVPVFKPSYGSLALKLICFLARLIEKMFTISETKMWGNPALIVSQSMTTKWTGLTWTVGVVGCLIQTGDVSWRCQLGKVNRNLTGNYYFVRLFVPKKMKNWHMMTGAANRTTF